MEDESASILRRVLPSAWVIRPYRPDYGLDFALELFKYVDQARTMAETLGEHVFVQLKSAITTTVETIRVHPRGNVAKGRLNESTQEFLDIEVIKFQIDTNELATVERMGSGAVVLLVLVTLDLRRVFYVCLNDLDLLPEI